jgi:hypothetical protein
MLTWSEVLPIASSRGQPVHFAHVSFTSRYRPSFSRLITTGTGLDWKIFTARASDSRSRASARLRSVTSIPVESTTGSPSSSMRSLESSTSATSPERFRHWHS